MNDLAQQRAPYLPLAPLGNGVGPSSPYCGLPRGLLRLECFFGRRHLTIA